MDWDELYCVVDDFMQWFEPQWQGRLLASEERRRKRKKRMSSSEVMTILIAFHSSHYRNFKHYYQMLAKDHQAEFPRLLSYNRFVEMMPSMLIPLSAFLQQNFGQCTGITFVDSTPLRVCGNKRIDRHKSLKAIARKGRSSMGWFYGLKLHLAINECGELLAYALTPGNVDDREPVPHLTKHLTGKLFGDKGYISASLFEQLWDQGLQLVTSIKRNMNNKLMPLIDKVLLRKRSLIETVNDQLKNIAQIEHTRHRSPTNFIINVVAALISYCLKPKKPHLRFEQVERNSIQTLTLDVTA